METSQTPASEDDKATTAVESRFIDNDLACLLMRASESLQAGIAPELTVAGLSSLEWKVLVVLHDMPRGWHVTGIARELNAKHSTIDKLVRRLAKEEIVTLEQDDGDARRLRVKATANGKRKVKRIMNAALAHEQALFAQLPAHISADDFKAAVKTITDFAQDMSKNRSVSPHAL